MAAACGGKVETAKVADLDTTGFDGIYDDLADEGRALTDLSGQCDFDPATGVMTLTMENDDIAIFARDTAGNVVINGFTCGAATTASLRRFDVVEDGVGGDQVIILDYLSGNVGLGNAMGAGAVISLGGGTDSFRVRGSSSADNMIFGVDGLAVNPDNFVDVTVTGAESYVLSLGPGNDVFSGAGTLRGTGTAFASVLSVYGGAGNDNLRGGAGDDLLYGGDNDDTFAGGNAPDGADTYEGGAGTDIADYASRTSSISVTIDGVADDGEAGENDNVGTDVENARGGQGNDYLEGSASVNVLSGGLGSDTLAGLGDADILNGDGGDDIFDEGMASNGNDVLNGGAGSDTADYSGRSVDLIVTINGTANDGEMSENDNVRTDVEIVLGGSGDDEITGGTGANTLNGGDGNDVLNGGAGNDILIGGLGTDEMEGGAGNDTFDEEAADSDADEINGGAGVDTIDYSGRTSSVSVTLDGLVGDGEVGEGDNIGTDVENVYCGAGDDYVVGSASANVIEGGIGADELHGGDGIDTISGGDGIDDIFGDAGEDLIDGDAGTDVIDCGAGDGDICADSADCAAALLCEL
jgi:Ca2+-binding RTX toxin-like protein